MYIEHITLTFLVFQRIGQNISDGQVLDPNLQAAQSEIHKPQNLPQKPTINENHKKIN